MTSTVDTKTLYEKVYRPDSGFEYEDGQVGERSAHLLGIAKHYIAKTGVPSSAHVLEVGAGVGALSSAHPNWQGVEYSPTAVAQARQIFGPDLNIHEGDARALPVADNSVDFLYSFATLEHVPEVERAFTEIERVLKPGGYAMLSPAWNCRSWTVKKLQQRPYRELNVSEKVQKFLIPLRESLAFRLLCSLPGRVLREIQLALGMRVKLHYTPLHPDVSLWDKYPHISDDDAFVSIDAHAALAYFDSRGWKLLSHPGIAKRFGCRGEEILVQKL
jgi:SAM-dependent methyltransferase